MIKICKHCKKKFEAEGNTKYCSNPICQAAKKEYNKAANKKYYREHKKVKTKALQYHVCRKCGKRYTNYSKRGCWCNNPECQTAKIAFYRNNHSILMKELARLHQDSNWTYHHAAKCNNCRHEKKLNRFGLCETCYSWISSNYSISTVGSVTGMQERTYG